MTFARRMRPERMDQPDLDPGLHRAALRGLARLNALTASAGLLWPGLKTLARRLGRPVRVLDLATGGGDVPVRLWRRARRAGLPLAFDGCDVSPVAVGHARALAERAGAGVRFFVHDALRGEPLAGYDAVTASLFLHHLGEADAVELLRRAAATAGHLVLVSDLVRSRAGWWLARVGVPLLTRSPVVHTDAPWSVEGAYTVAELRALAERAGLAGAAVRRRWPWRMLLTWERP